MARIELRNSTIRLRDGYSNTGAVNGSPTSGDTTLAIDTVTEVDTDGNGTMSKVIPLSSRFTVVGSTATYTVTAQDAQAQLDIDLDAGTGNFTITVAGQETATIAHDADVATITSAVEALSTVESGDFTITKPTASTVQLKATSTGQYDSVAVVMSGDVSTLTGGTPTAVQTYDGGETHDITFTPALSTTAGVPSDDAVITFTGRSLEVKVGDGNCEFTENRAFLYDLDRGLLDTVRQDDDVPMDVSLDFIWEHLTAISGASTPTISDVLHRRGAAASWKSSSSDTCEPFAIDIEIEYVPPCGDEPTEFITLSDFRWESLPHSVDDAQVSMTGRCNVTEAMVNRASS